MDSTMTTNVKQRLETSVDLIRFILWRTTQQTLNINDKDINYILYDLCTNHDPYVIEKIKILSEWIVQLRNSYSRNVMKNYVPQSVFVKTIASIFWALHEECKYINLEKLITQNVFDACWYCVSTFNRSEPLKIAFDSLLRSLCYINQKYFNQILVRANVVEAINLSSSVEISLPPESKFKMPNGGNFFEHIITYLPTIAASSQSSSVIYQLVDSGLPKVLVHALFDFANHKLMNVKSKQTKLQLNPIKSKMKASNSINAPTHLTDADNIEKVVVDNFCEMPLLYCEIVPEILDFLAECCSEGYMRDWLGLKQNTIFWRPLLKLICNQMHDPAQAPEAEMFNRIERSIIRFFSCVTACHTRNQDTLICLLLSIIRQSELLESQKMRNCKRKSNETKLSVFIRQMIVQIFLKNEYIYVLIKGDQMFKRLNAMNSNLSSSSSSNSNTNQITAAMVDQQEIHNFNTRQLLLKVSLHANFKDILKDCVKKFQIISKAKSEKIKIINSEESTTFQFNKTLMTFNKEFFINEPVQLVHPDYPDIFIPDDTIISQLLTILQIKDHPFSTPFITLEMVPRKAYRGNIDVDESDIINAVTIEKLPSLLQCFARRGGLTLLELFMPIVLPDTFLVPLYTLAAFRQFLRLPSYADVLLQYEVNAICLLKLLFGETKDDEGNDICKLKLMPSLHKLPFVVFRQLLEDSSLNTDEAIALRSMAIEVGAMHAILDTLKNCKYQLAGYYDKQKLYWPKGTGFATGPINNTTKQLKRKEEELITELLLILSSYMNPGDKPLPLSLFTDELILCHEICDNLFVVPPIFIMHLEESALIPMLNSYLQNDSILDISRNVPFYRTVLKLLRAMISQKFISLLTMKCSPTSPSVAEQILEMKACVKPYFECLSNSKKHIPKVLREWNLDFVDDDELVYFVSDLYDTALIIQKTIKLNDFVGEKESFVKGDRKVNSMPKKTYDDLNASTTNTPTNVRNDNKQQDIENTENGNLLTLPQSNSLFTSIEQRYLDVMKKLQFNSYDMIVELDNNENNNSYRFDISYHFEKLARIVNYGFQPAKIKRLAQDVAILSKSLPLSYSSTIFVRCDTNRLDIMKVLITGPADTPYANGCFEFDVYFPPEYPKVPMMVNLETTGRRTVRFNPNLYNSGKVCLSILNTWHGGSEEMWNAQTSSFLQVLVSIQSLILVPEPYFNEPGFLREYGTPNGKRLSREYNIHIYQECLRWAMLDQIRNPNPCFKEIIHTHFWLKRHEICAQIENWIQEITNENDIYDFKIDILLHNYQNLREELSKLKTPPGLEDLDTPFNPAVPLSILEKQDKELFPTMSLSSKNPTQLNIKSQGVDCDPKIDLPSSISQTLENLNSFKSNLDAKLEEFQQILSADCTGAAVSIPTSVSDLKLNDQRNSSPTSSESALTSPQNSKTASKRKFDCFSS